MSTASAYLECVLREGAIQTKYRIVEAWQRLLGIGLTITKMMSPRILSTIQEPEIIKSREETLQGPPKVVQKSHIYSRTDSLKMRKTAARTLTPDGRTAARRRRA